MKTFSPAAGHGAPTLRAFSLMELLLSVSMMTVIVAALYAVFHQTQRALHSSLTQVDALESGRAAMDILTRDLAQVTACGVAGGTNLLCFLSPVYTKDVRQALMNGGTRTNHLQEIYFLSRYDRDWIETGYRVVFASNGLGTLGRFQLKTNYYRPRYNRRPGSNQLASLASIVRTQQDMVYSNFPVAQGVIHLRLQAYDGSGLPMNWYTTNRYTNYVADGSGARHFLYPTVVLGTNVFLVKEELDPTETRFAFLSNALPAYLELELGLLESKARDQFQALAGSPMAERFLSNRAGQVHLFRQRIPLRESVLFQAYHP